MAFVTPRMSLLVWNNLSDPYDHEQLAANFLKLDQHNHTQGQGTQIPNAGLQDGAVTAQKIYPGSINADALSDGSVSTSKIGDRQITHTKIGLKEVYNENIADAAVGAIQLGPSSVSTNALQDQSVTQQKLDPTVVPIGTVISWYRPNSTPLVPIPNKWVVCEGQTLTNAVGATPQHDFATPSGTIVSIVLPDLRNKFVLGADQGKPFGYALGVGGEADGTANAPGVMGTGGHHQIQVSAHSHDLSNHTHLTDVTNHRHQLADAPGWGWTSFKPGLQTPDSLYALYNGGVYNPTPVNATGQSTTSNIRSQGPSANYTSMAAAYNLAVVPNYVGLIYLIKVRNV